MAVHLFLNLVDCPFLRFLNLPIIVIMSEKYERKLFISKFHEELCRITWFHGKYLRFKMAYYQQIINHSFSPYYISCLEKFSSNISFWQNIYLLSPQTFIFIMCYNNMLWKCSSCPSSSLPLIYWYFFSPAFKKYIILYLILTHYL